MRSFARASDSRAAAPHCAEPAARMAMPQVAGARMETGLHPGFRLADIALLPSASPRAEASGSAAPYAVRRPNRTGLPDRLKARVEALSGLSLDDVRVHRNSPKPAQLRALAYARGTEIHLGPGQERHLPHEAWHVVQQKQGRVRPTFQLKGVPINDDVRLEAEAQSVDLFREGGTGPRDNAIPGARASGAGGHRSTILQAAGLVKDKLNVVGEDHTDYEEPNLVERRKNEEKLAAKVAGGGYWKEDQFSITITSFLRNLFGSEGTTVFGDPPILRMQTFANKVIEILSEIEKDIPDGRADIGNEWAQRLSQARVKVKIENNVSGFIRARDNANTHDPEKLSAFSDVEGFSHFLGEIYAIRKRGEAKDIVPLLKSFDEKKKIWTNDNGKLQNIRSASMHEIATKGNIDHKKRGIWKIGDAHITDIKGISESKRVTLIYNLMSRDEFFAKYSHDTNQEVSIPYEEGVET